jgi:hypothetical protein
MRLFDIRVEPIPCGTRLSAAVTSPHLPTQDFRLWFEYTSPSGPVAAAPYGDAFLAAALPVAMVLGEPLSIEAPVSSCLLNNTAKIADILHLWIAGAQRVALECPVREPAAQAAGTGCFFSCGVDSYYSLLKHRNSISHLITVHGFDCYLNDNAVFPQLQTSASRAAAAMGLTPVSVKTNIRDFSDSFLVWGMYFGAAASAVALGMQGTLGRALLASSISYRALYPWGSHPLLDPLWSSGETAIVHDGCEASRVQKVEVISANAMAMETLRVCCHDANSYNCGRCEKCVRTMLELYVCGALGKCKTLPPALTASMIEAITVDSTGGAVYFAASKKRLGTTGIDAGYRQAIDRVLGAWEERKHGETGVSAGLQTAAPEPVQSQIAALRWERQELVQAKEHLERELAAIRGSRTWRYGLRVGGIVQKALAAFGAPRPQGNAGTRDASLPFDN